MVFIHQKITLDFESKRMGLHSLCDKLKKTVKMDNHLKNSNKKCHKNILFCHYLYLLIELKCKILIISAWAYFQWGLLSICENQEKGGNGQIEIQKYGENSQRNFLKVPKTH